MGNANYRFLLIGEAQASWSSVLAEALDPLGELYVVSEEEGVQKSAQDCYDVIVVDAGVVGEAARLVRQLRQQSPDARLVVATESPTWRRARAAFEAGATDYIRRSLDAKELQRAIREVLELQPPPRPHQIA